MDYYRIEIEAIGSPSRAGSTSPRRTSKRSSTPASVTPAASRRCGSSRTCRTVEASGIDVVATLPFNLAGGVSGLTLAANWSDVELTKFNPEIHERQPSAADRARASRLPLHADLEPHPGQVAADGPGTALRRVLRRADQRRLGGVSIRIPACCSTSRFRWMPPTRCRSYSACRTRSTSIRPPTRNGEVAGLVYPEQSPFGFNGGFYYFRAQWRMQ